MGDLSVKYETAGYKVLGQKFNLTLTYDSGLVRNWFPLVFSEDNSETIKPDSIHIKCQYEGNQFETVFIPNQSKPVFPVMLPTTDGAGNKLATGFYHFKGEISNKYNAGYYWSASCFSCPPDVNTGKVVRDPMINTQKVEGDFYVHNPETQAPYGKGWDMHLPKEHRLYKAKGTNRVIVEMEGNELAVLHGGLLQRISNTNHMDRLDQHKYDSQSGVQFDGTQSIADYRMEEWNCYYVRDGVMYYTFRSSDVGSILLELGKDGKIKPIICSHDANVKYPFMKM